MHLLQQSAEDLYWEEVEDAWRIAPDRKLVLGLVHVGADSTRR